MKDITIDEFVKLVRSSKKINSIEDFAASIKDTNIYAGIIDYIEKVNKDFSDKYGLSVEKIDNKKEHLSDKEVAWKKYFKDHSFDSLQEAKNLADAVSILTEIDIGRFIRVDSQRVSFPYLVAIVPIDNTNSHCYDLGSPILKLSATGSSGFSREDGMFGNNMDERSTSIRVADSDEIDFIVLATLYRNPEVLDYIMPCIKSFLSKKKPSPTPPPTPRVVREDTIVSRNTLDEIFGGRTDNSTAATISFRDSTVIMESDSSE